MRASLHVVGNVFLDFIYIVHVRIMQMCINYYWMVIS